MIQRLVCPVSGDTAGVVFSRPYSLPELRSFAGRAGMSDQLADKPYEIRHCPTSGLYFQTWVMEDGELNGLYSSPTDEKFFIAQIEGQKLHWFAHMTEELLVLRQMLPATRRPVVLDFGCNWGKWASMALAHGCDVYAVEVNQAAADFCMRRGIKILALSELSKFHFDFINVDQVMEHLSEPLRVAKTLASCLEPGAFMKWSTPNNENLPRLLRAAQAGNDNSVLDAQTIDSLAPLEHVNLFSNTSLKFLAAEAGLQPVRLPFWKWTGAGQLWNLPRQLNRNVTTPWKRWRRRGTYLWLQQSAEP